MKPTRDGEGVARDMTSEKLLDPNMTQDEPERETVEEAQPVCVYCDRVLACDRCGKEQPYDDLSVLKAKLSTALVISNNYQSLMVTAERERDEAKAVSGTLAENLHELQADYVTAQSERDSARASLSRMWEALKPFAVCAATFEEDTPDSFPLFSFNEADEIEELEIELGDLRKARALHRSQGG